MVLFYDGGRAKGLTPISTEGTDLIVVIGEGWPRKFCDLPSV
jgi:hypothetical protein